jgi:NADH:ubiquinone oxidoreductase subunit 3 (subunit A)
MYYDGPSRKFTSGDGSMGNMLQPWHFIILFFIVAPITMVVLAPFWMIFKKAGFQPILSVLMLVPLVNLVAIYIVAFSEWKAAPGQKL